MASAGRTLTIDGPLEVPAVAVGFDAPERDGGEQHVAVGKRDVGVEARPALHAAAGEGEHALVATHPLQRLAVRRAPHPTAQPQAIAIQAQSRVGVRLLDRDSVCAPADRLGQMGFGSAVGAESEGVAGRRPRQRDAAAVAALLLAPHAEGDRILKAPLGDVGHLGQTQLVTLVEVHGPGQSHDDHGGGPGPTLALHGVLRRSDAIGADPRPGHALGDARRVGGIGLTALGVVGRVEAQAGGHARGVVAAEDPGG